MKIIAAYARVSTAGQTILNQERAIKKWCLQEGIPLVSLVWYFDDGVSGLVSHEKRSGAAQLIEDAKKGLFSRVLIFSASRLSRDYDFFMVIKILYAQGIVINSISEGIDTSTRAGRMALNFSGLVGIDGREGLLASSAEGRERALSQNKWPSRPPLGYKLVNKFLVIDEQTRPIIELMFELYVERGYGFAKIAKHFTDMKILGKRWGYTSIHSKIINPVYMGEGYHYDNGKKKKYGIKVDPIVTRETFEKAQSIRLGRVNAIKPSVQRVYEFILPLVICAYCGKHYHRRSYINKSGSLGLAYRHYEVGECEQTGKEINSKKIEPQVWGKIEALIDKPSLWESYVEVPKSEAQQGALERVNQEIEANSKSLDLLEKERFEDMTISRERYNALAKRLYEKNERLNKEMTYLENELRKEAQRLSNASAKTEHLNHLKASGLTATTVGRFEIVKALIECVVIRVEGQWRTKTVEITIKWR